MNESDAFDDPLARPPRSVHTGPSRSAAETIKFVLGEEGIPSVVEPERGRDGQTWRTLVAEDAFEDARRALDNRTKLASNIDWDQYDIGEPSSRDVRVLRSAPLVRRLSRAFMGIGSVLILVMVLLGIVAMIANLLPST